MSEEKDETAGFTVTSSDMPEAAPAPEPEEKTEEPASSEASPEPKADDEPKGEEKAPEVRPDETAGDDAPAEPVQQKKPNKTQKRINELVRKSSDATRRAEAAERELADLKGKKEPEPKAEPVEDDFDSYDEYLDALDAHEKQGSGDKANESTEKSEKSEDVATLTDSQKTAMDVIKEAVSSAETPEDFDAVALDPEVPITGDMLEALAECDDPAKVMYHLGQNKDVAKSVAESSPAQQARAIAKLDMTVKVTPPKPVKTTEAAEPITPVGGSDAQEKAVSDMSFSEYEAHMNKKERSSKSAW